VIGLRQAWALLLVFVAILAVGVGSMIYSNHTAAASQRQWCDLLLAFDDAYREVPPQTPAGVKIAERLAELRDKRFECPTEE
jgi:hypothetical protein